MGKKSPCLSCKHKNVYEPLTRCFVCNFSGIECKNFEMYKPKPQTNGGRIRAMSYTWYTELKALVTDMMTVSGFYDTQEIHENCTVQIWRNSRTGAVSIGWWENGGDG